MLARFVIENLINIKFHMRYKVFALVLQKYTQETMPYAFKLIMLKL